MRPHFVFVPGRTLSQPIRRRTTTSARKRIVDYYGDVSVDLATCRCLIGDTPDSFHHPATQVSRAVQFAGLMTPPALAPPAHLEKTKLKIKLKSRSSM
ncbi:MAG: hypothetical protein COT80_04575 [Candidatus Buchananbacteria bacterium CG10_big_fil_rev_8_21_14_0_10_33_19]|uniref:Uncharacterized protein n=1 Tax=Candidatus Buchananbacteria bacterium CG10_big_fil_rev_8_21_14_0_10_33_19 TaxID=1974525 RepID=A0A2H0W5X3_9BACT|nr:MAG: hypothetical protein COT80_04575 [Candidatus Buchananbacteria bacterium CG10_big_fil_rev_8_21_14_0_10_33_19]